jgi:hypothetical protein
LSIFGDIERFAAELYPYRWAITIGLVVIVLGFLAFAYWRGWHAAVWKHKVLSGAIAGVMLAAMLVAGNYFLSPLWERSYLEEASPLDAQALEPTGTRPAVEPTGDGSARPTAGQSSTPAFVLGLRAQGGFIGADDFHFGRGEALLIETGPAVYTLRFEEFSVRNGPDLFVYLTQDKDSVDGAINLGVLKATDGAFNYEVPPGTDVSRYTYAIVWCRQFAVLFASAELTPA